MINTVKVRKYRDAQRPKLKYIVAYKEDGGKRKRSFFETREKAQAFADDWNVRLKNEGREVVVSFDSSLRVMASECAEQLAKFGKSIADATAFFVDHLQKAARSITVAALVDEVIERKSKETKNGQAAKKSYLHSLNVLLGRFKKEFGDRLASEFDVLEISDWLDGLRNLQTGAPLSRQSRSNMARALGVMFSYAKFRRYVATNPITEIPKPSSGSLPEILSVEQLSRMLEIADPDLLPVVAIGAFAGLRTDEIMRLDWADINFQEGFIKVNSSKHGGERHVDITETLRAWIGGLCKVSGPIKPTNFRKRIDALRKAAGITPWPNNGLRHSFASYHLAYFNNDALTRMQMGHWRESAMLIQHYRRAVSKADGQRYWALRPVAAGKVIDMAAA